jgi:hypothetical protein
MQSRLYSCVNNGRNWIKGIAINGLFLRLPRQLLAQILMYDLYTPVLCAGLSCTHKKILITSDTLFNMLGKHVVSMPRKRILPPHWKD